MELQCHRARLSSSPGTSSLLLLSKACVPQLYFGVVVGVWSYNAIVHAWEVVFEPWNLIINGNLITAAAE